MNLIAEDAKEWNDFNHRASRVIEKERTYWNTSLKGENPDVFQYQFNNVDGFGCQTLALTFYRSINVYVIYSEKSIKDLRNEHKALYKISDKLLDMLDE